MRRNATLSLDGFDSEVLDAAREVARRAGVPLEAWLDSVVGAEPATSLTPGEAPSVAGDRPVAGERAAAPPSRRDTPDTAHRPSRPTPSSANAPAPSSVDAVGGAIAAMMQRIDSLDRSIAEERQAAQQATADAVGQIERRVSELSQQLSRPRPLGRRGRPLVAEVRDAVDEVRRRQEELDAPAGATASRDYASAAPSPAEGTLPTIGELQRETHRLRESIGSLATGQDVVALEQAMRAFATDIQRAQEPGDLAAIAAPIELMRVQVGRLADDVADNVHARLSGEVERLSARVDGALSSSSASADKDALGGLFRELDEIRRLVASLAGPERIQGLALGLQSVSAQIAQLQSRLGVDASGVAELKPLLEEIRVGMQAPTESRALLGRIEELADRMDRQSINPVGDLLDRLEDLGETLRRPQPQDDSLATIHGMLHSLAEKVDRVGSHQGGESLDGLEQQVTALASRLDARAADPSLAGVERTMHELLAQVSALRDESAIEAAVERATRDAVARTVGDTKVIGDTSAGATVALRADLADLRERQAAADARMQATMENVHSALERLVGHLGNATPQATVVGSPVAEDGRSIAERLRASTAAAPVTPPPAREPVAPMPRPSRSARLPELPKTGPAESVRDGEELLEPGTARPGPGQPVSADPALNPAAGGDIKTSFIAAARRAAQAAQADVAADVPAPARRSDRVSRKVEGVTAASSAAGRGARLRSEIEKRRRPLLLGLAAIVLALGAMQAYQATVGAPTMGSEPVTVAATTPPASPAPTEPTPAAGQPQTPGPADPQTTQSIAATAASEPKAAAGTGGAAPAVPATGERKLPKVSDMASLNADLAGVPGGLSKLKASALAGDGTAVWELASREAEGRGMSRDLALAGKLYGKLAEAGYAPAQFKLGSFYEKGSGVVRELGQAKIWYERSAAQGHVRSMHNLAVVHAENPIANGKPDFALAASWFRRAAEYGVRDSQYNLAVLYARGLGVSQDLAQSYLWFAAAAAQGDEEAGRKRDDVGAKLTPKDLAAAKALVASFKPKAGDPAVNEPPKPAGPPPMSLLGAPPPGSPPAPAPPRPGQAGA